MDISKLKPSSAEAIIFSLSPIFSMAVLFYVKDPKLFLSMDIFKLIILCTGFSIPLYVLNYMTIKRYALDLEESKNENVDINVKGGSGTFTSFQISIVSLLLVYYPMNVPSIVFILLSIWLAFRLIAASDKIRSTRETKTDSSQTE